MWSLKEGLDIFEKFNFDRQPVGVKYLYFKPAGVKRLDKNMSWCEMLPAAQQADPFYIDKDNCTCAPGIIVGGEHPPALRGGGLSFHGGYDPRAGIRFKNLHIPRMPKDIINYVVFSPLNKLPFDPDILVITCDVSQAEILLRASSYKSGKPWTSRTSLYLQCAWLLVHPYLTGELNYTVTGTSYGMKLRRVLPEGLMLISIPFDLLPTIIQNLEEMEWYLKAYTMDKDEYFKWYDSQIAKVSKEQTDVSWR